FFFGITSKLKKGIYRLPCPCIHQLFIDRLLVQQGVNQATILKLAKALIYKTFDFWLLTLDFRLGVLGG
ncbi:MAG: hypothetical protein V7L00_31385, partial [Nostoc sp.]|uniref:hypothetical protein n=1 Tax=Nostoc sp. TaxID=1180 RepID=UPI002FF715FE